MESSPSSSSSKSPSQSFIKLGLGLGFLVAAAAFLLNIYYKRRTSLPGLWIAEELAMYNGTDERLPILLGILGSVFDVTKGRSHYGPGGGYHHFAGRFVGKLVGRYYDGHSNPTKYLKGVEAKAKRGAQLLEKQKIEEAKIPSCNSRWSQEEGGKVWCDGGYPRLVKRPLDSAITGKVSQRCACFKEDELDRPGLEVYKGCEFSSQTCNV